MKLVYKHGEERHFKIIRYPDGQQNVQLDLSYFNNPKEPIEIVCSVRNFQELEVLLCIVAALRKEDFYIQEIKFMYLFGMRADRSFDPGQPNYFRDVVAPIINSLQIPEVEIFYPHSKLSLAALKNASWHFKYIDMADKCFNIGADQSASINDMFWEESGHQCFVKTRCGDSIQVNLPSDTYYKVEILNEFCPILIYDDLCDGGATFIAIADYMNEHFPDRKKFLFVAHGLFSKGVEHVAKHFDKVITTNSYQHLDAHSKLEVIDIWT